MIKTESLVIGGQNFMRTYSENWREIPDEEVPEEGAEA